MLRFDRLRVAIVGVPCRARGGFGRRRRRAIVTTGSTVYRLHGEIDMANAADVARALDDVARVSSTPVVLVDCADLTFIDSSGLLVLMRIARRLEGEGRRLRIVNLLDAQRRVFEVAGLDDMVVD
jgi:anti-sigma B factor antagonist